VKRGASKVDPAPFNVIPAWARLAKAGVILKAAIAAAAAIEAIRRLFKVMISFVVMAFRHLIL
jgi:hypothetical protein